MQTADDDRSRSCVACPGARHPREGEAIPPSATGAGVDLAGGAVAVGEGPHRRHRCTLTAEGPPPGRPPRHARPRGSGVRGRRRARSCGAQDWTGSRTCRGQGHGTSVRCFKVKMNVKHRGGREFQKLPRRAPGPTQQGPTGGSDCIHYRVFCTSSNLVPQVSPSLCSPCSRPGWNVLD